MRTSAPDHARHSVLREIILEHLFVGELLRHLWLHGIHDAEILRSEFDAGGYDLVLSHGSLTRHIQLKAQMLDGKAAKVSVGTRLAARHSGCVIWMIVTEMLTFDHFLWFGGAPGQPLPDLSNFRTTRHTKGNAEGIKAERPAHRDVPKSAFEKIESLDALLHKLMGKAPVPPEAQLPALSAPKYPAGGELPQGQEGGCKSPPSPVDHFSRR